MLKMDIEGAEWKFFKSDMVGSRLADVDQLVLEVHVLRKNNWRAHIREQITVLHNLEKWGFVLFNARINPNGFDLRAYDHTKSFKDSDQLLLELSYIKRR